MEPPRKQYKYPREMTFYFVSLGVTLLIWLIATPFLLGWNIFVREACGVDTFDYCRINPILEQYYLNAPESPLVLRQDHYVGKEPPISLDESEITVRASARDSAPPDSIKSGDGEWTTFGTFTESWVMINNPNKRQSTKIKFENADAEYVDIFSFDSQTDTVKLIGRAQINSEITMISLPEPTIVEDYLFNFFQKKWSKISVKQIEFFYDPLELTQEVHKLVESSLANQNSAAVQIQEQPYGKGKDDFCEQTYLISDTRITVQGEEAKSYFGLDLYIKFESSGQKWVLFNFMIDSPTNCQMVVEVSTNYILPTQIDLWQLETVESKQFTKLASVQSFDENGIGGQVWISLEEAASGKSRALLLNVHSDKAGTIYMPRFAIYNKKSKKELFSKILKVHRREGYDDVPQLLPVVIEGPLCGQPFRGLQLSGQEPWNKWIARGQSWVSVSFDDAKTIHSIAFKSANLYAPKRDPVFIGVFVLQGREWTVLHIKASWSRRWQTIHYNLPQPLTSMEFYFDFKNDHESLQLGEILLLPCEGAGDLKLVPFSVAAMCAPNTKLFADSILVSDQSVSSDLLQSSKVTWSHQVPTNKASTISISLEFKTEQAMTYVGFQSSDDVISKDPRRITILASNASDNLFQIGSAQPKWGKSQRSKAFYYELSTDVPIKSMVFQIEVDKDQTSEIKLKQILIYNC